MTTVSLLCMTCCARLSQANESPEIAEVNVIACAIENGWIRIERQPGHSADVCAECASLIAETWSGIVAAELQRMRSASVERMNRETAFTDEESAAFVKALRTSESNTDEHDTKGLRK